MTVNPATLRNDLLTCRPDLSAVIQSLAEADLLWIQYTVNAALEESYWSTLRWMLEYHTHFDEGSRAK